jgi:4'-phosphopantetheinyl transferase
MSGSHSADVHVWHVHLNRAGTSCSAHQRLLSAEERRRVRRLRNADERRRFFLSHVALRGVLARYTARAPEQLVFATGVGGKPELSHHSRPQPAFNLSHSGNMALIAVAAPGVDVGVDVERIRRWSARSEAPLEFLSDRERGVLANVPAALWGHAFAQSWVRKEAVTKAMGVGMGARAAALDLGVWPSEAPRLRAEYGAPNATEWRLADLTVAGPYAAALAVRGQPRRILERDIDVRDSVADSGEFLGRHNPRSRQWPWFRDAPNGSGPRWFPMTSAAPVPAEIAGERVGDLLDRGGHIRECAVGLVVGAADAADVVDWNRLQFR